MKPAARSEIMASGILSGLIAGVVMLVAADILMGMFLQDLFYPLRLMGAAIHGSDALSPDFPQGIITGLMIHLVVSSLLGMWYAAFTTRRTPTLPAVVHGLFFGVFIWGFMTFLTLPLFNPVMYENLQSHWIGWALSHLVFGASLAMAPALRRVSHLRARWSGVPS